MRRLTHMNDDLETSLDLLRRVQAGDASALDALMVLYRPRLVRWASGRLPAYARGMAETQDLVQETLAAAFKKIAHIEIRDEGAVQAYLRQALLNAIRMEIRRVTRRPASQEIDSGLPAADISPLEAAIGAETLERYERALDHLREEERELVIAHVEFGLTHQELAAAFKKPSANAARMALQRALIRVAVEMAAPPAHG
jgi:RNA polymerase sigma-70 factor (ECF subfamily)